MKKWFLFIAVIFAVSCEKSETYNNPYYTKEQLAILTELCAPNGWGPPKDAYKPKSCSFVTIDNKPFTIKCKDSDIEIQADGIVSLQRYYNWRYYYYKLISDREIHFFYIKDTVGNYGVVNDIIATIPPYTYSATWEYSIWTDDENYTYLNLEGDVYFRR